MSLGLNSWISRIRMSIFTKQVVGIVRRTHFANKVLGFTPFGIAFARCEAIDDKETIKPENLTREQCIKQACLLSVNSATTLLTTTSSAILDVCKVYKDSLNRMLFLLEEAQAMNGENPELWDAIVEARASVNRAKASLNELTLYMQSVEKVVTSTTEAAFLAGADYVCTALCERLYSAQKEIDKQIVYLKQLEEDYLKLQREIASTKEKEDKSNSTANKSKEVAKTKIDENFSQAVKNNASVA